MDSWIKKLWKNNKIAFFLLIPVILLVVFRNVVIDILVKDSRRIANETEDKDKELAEAIIKANTKADQIKDDANKLSVDKPPVNEDWHKNE